MVDSAQESDKSVAVVGTKALLWLEGGIRQSVKIGVVWRTAGPGYGVLGQ